MLVSKILNGDVNKDAPVEKTKYFLTYFAVISISYQPSSTNAFVNGTIGSMLRTVVVTETRFLLFL